METFNEINNLKEKFKKITNFNDYKELFKEIKENLTTNLLNGIASIGCNYFGLILTFLSVGFQNSIKFDEQKETAGTEEFLPENKED